MKKINLLLCCLSLLGVFNACESNYVSHDNVGKHVFQILQTLDTLPKEKFRQQFIPFDQLQKMIQNVKEGEKLIPKIAQMSKEAYNSDIDNIYQITKVDAENNNIRWEAISFKDYKYRTSRNRGMTLNDGLLYFKNKEEMFSIKVFWLTDLTASGLLGLGGIRKVE